MSTKSSSGMKANVTSHLKARERLSLWMATLAGQRQEHDNESHRRNRDAEEQHARKHVWGYTEPTGDEDMSDRTFLGDISITQPQSRGLSPLLAAAIGMAIPGVGIGGYFVNEILNQTAAPTTGTDTTTEITLRKIGDYLDLPGP